MKVFIYATELRLGGAEKQISLLRSALIDSGVDCEVISVFSSDVFKQDLAYFSAPRSSLLKGLLLILGLIRILFYLRNQRNNEVVFFSLLDVNNFLSFFVSIFYPRFKYVHGIRGGVRDGVFESRARIVRFANSACDFFGRNFDFPDLTIFNSNRGLSQFRESGFYFRNASVIGNIVEFSPKASPSISREIRTFGTLGRIIPIKNVEGIILAFKRLTQSVRSELFELYIGGPIDTRFARELVEKYSSVPNVYFVDYVTDTDQFLRGLDLFVFASHQGEGFPNVIGEAVAAGCIPVVADSGDSYELVPSKLLRIEGYSPDAIFKTMVSVINSDPGAIEHEFQKCSTAVRKFSREHIAESYTAEFRDLF